MRQHITADQLQGLADWQKQKLREWWKPEKGDHFTEPCTDCSWHKGEEVWHEGIVGGWTNEDQGAEPNERALPLLSIGQMFQLISDKTGRIPEVHDIKTAVCRVLINIGGMTTAAYESVEPCDALWEALKTLLIMMV